MYSNVAVLNSSFCWETCENKDDHSKASCCRDEAGQEFFITVAFAFPLVGFVFVFLLFTFSHCYYLLGIIVNCNCHAMSELESLSRHEWQDSPEKEKDFLLEASELANVLQHLQSLSVSFFSIIFLFKLVEEDKICRTSS